MNVLGPNDDLLLWIPKKPGILTTDNQRPLQLPSTKRRLFGSTVMDEVGPLMEPEFSEHQTAIRGGSCGPNIRKAFTHLAGTTADSECPEIGAL
eukprot:3771604-Heterocapsa_arctica.AAC.1